MKLQSASPAHKPWLNENLSIFKNYQFVLVAETGAKLLITKLFFWFYLRGERGKRKLFWKIKLIVYYLVYAANNNLIVDKSKFVLRLRLWLLFINVVRQRLGSLLHVLGCVLCVVLAPCTHSIIHACGRVGVSVDCLRCVFWLWPMSMYFRISAVLTRITNNAGLSLAHFYTDGTDTDS